MKTKKLSMLMIFVAFLLGACSASGEDATATPTISFENYYAGTADVLIQINESFSIFSELNGQLSEDINLMGDDVWRESIVAEMLAMNSLAQSLVNENAPTEFEAFQGRLNQLAFEINQMVAKYAQGIDNGDNAVFQESLQHAENAVLILFAALERLEGNAAE
jgi:hypothetical protein